METHLDHEVKEAAVIIAADRSVASLNIFAIDLCLNANVLSNWKTQD
jgi:hypothetical protein